ncbi:MAG: DUF1353 domain-containing protein [Propionibacteriaceae bacterium]|jgi:hypothetical protein|nr:DUF1353 domain-containing protein [Propionibacteriaceae bacterium]
MPYVLPAGSNPATTAVQLRLDTPRLFSLMTPFWYAPERPLPAGLDAALPATAPDPPDDSARWLKVGDERRPPLTDLASVPGVLWGLIASYGRHTLAVLVHDRLSAYADEGAEGERFVRQTAADEVFFQALRDPGRPDFRAPWFRSLVLWAGVSAARYWRFNRPGFVALAGATLGLWLAGWWLAQSIAGPAQPLAAAVLLVVSLVVLGVAGQVAIRVQRSGRTADRWISQALVALTIALLAAATFSSLPWPPVFGLALPGWAGLAALALFVAGSGVLAASPVRRDALLPLVVALAGPWVGLVAGVTVVVLYLLWIPDAFSPASCGPINTVEIPTNTVDGPRG